MRSTRRVIAAFVAAVPALAWAHGGGALRDASVFFDRGLFDLQDNYEIDGTVASVDAGRGQITIAREDVPAATLTVAPDTRVRVDGEVAALSAIQPGSEVRATFNVARQTPLAIELEVDSPRDLSAGSGLGYYDPYYEGPWSGDGLADDGGYYDPVAP